MSLIEKKLENLPHKLIKTENLSISAMLILLVIGVLFAFIQQISLSYVQQN